MVPEPRPTLPATMEQLDDALEYASKLEHAFSVCPPVESPSRRRWEIHFKQDLYALITQLAKANFEHLPAFAMGCIWLHNHAQHNGIAFDPEAILPAKGDHPALKGPGKLKYQPAEDGPNGLRPENELHSIWWDTFRAGAFHFLCATRPPRISEAIFHYISTEASERASHSLSNSPATAGVTGRGRTGMCFVNSPAWKIPIPVDPTNPHISCDMY